MVCPSVCSIRAFATPWRAAAPPKPATSNAENPAHLGLPRRRRLPSGGLLGNDHDCNFNAVVVGADVSIENVQAIADALMATGLFNSVSAVQMPIPTTKRSPRPSPVAAPFAYAAAAPASTTAQMGDSVCRH